MATTILRLPTVKARTGLGSSTIYKFISEGRFPKAVALGDRAVGYGWNQKSSSTSKTGSIRPEKTERSDLDEPR